jgi:biotin carboxylase
MRDTVLFLAHVPTEALNRGFLPAAQSMGLKVILLTDQAATHHHYFSQPDLPAYPEKILQCDVFNPLPVLDILADLPVPVGVFSNSDHLQTVTALAADYLGLPGKDWQICYRAKNKAAMRQYLKTLDKGTCWFRVVSDQASLANVIDDISFPCIAKPREGVASLNVRRMDNAMQLQSFCDQFWQDQPGQTLLLEEFLSGPVHTLETIGDGNSLIALGGFEVRLSEPPHFVELEAAWAPYQPDSPHLQEMFKQVRRFGVGLGSCHSEFVITDNGPRLIEINYRTVGDGREFLLDRMMDRGLFRAILQTHLGNPLELSPPTQAAQIRYLSASTSGRVRRSARGRTEPCGDGIAEFEPLKEVGDDIRLTHSNKDYLGVLRLFSSDPSRVKDTLAEWARDLDAEWEIG